MLESRRSLGENNDLLCVSKEQKITFICDSNAIPAFCSCDGLKDSDTIEGYMRFKAYYIKEEERYGARVQTDGVLTDKWKALYARLRRFLKPLCLRLFLLLTLRSCLFKM